MATEVPPTYLDHEQLARAEAVDRAARNLYRGQHSAGELVYVAGWIVAGDDDDDGDEDPGPDPDPVPARPPAVDPEPTQYRPGTPIPGRDTTLVGADGPEYFRPAGPLPALTPAGAR